MNKKNIAEKRDNSEDTIKIYIGPSLRGVAHGTVFRNGLSPVLEDMIRKFPVVKELVVPVSSLQNANRQLNNPDSALSRFFHIVEKCKEGEV